MDCQILNRISLNYRKWHSKGIYVNANMMGSGLVFCFTCFVLNNAFVSIFLLKEQKLIQKQRLDFFDFGFHRFAFLTRWLN